MNKYMQKAAESALNGVEQGHGGPFGAAIVQNGNIIACEHNRVLLTNDPTMHAEIAAIREACRLLDRFSLSDCEIYSTCMPCPMCMSAIMWAKIPQLYYGATARDAAGAGFDDEDMYDFIKNDFNGEKLSIKIVDPDECRRVFDKWNNKRDRNMY
ncbi:MAG: nucleoside deaminase [Oscillospiraceae bacterium]|nr:nucleoside deaminase [Oscillospiraceae bacterium]